MANLILFIQYNDIFMSTSLNGHLNFFSVDAKLCTICVGIYTSATEKFKNN